MTQQQTAGEGQQTEAHAVNLACECTGSPALLHPMQCTRLDSSTGGRRDSVRHAVLMSFLSCRYIVIPARPAGTEGWTEEQLMQLVTRDSMIGVAPALRPDQIAAA